MTALEYLDKLLPIYIGLRKRIITKYKNLDVRNTYFLKISNSYRIYYVYFASIHFVEYEEQIKQSDWYKSIELISKKHIDNLFLIKPDKNPTAHFVDVIMLRSSLLISVWNIFESTIAELFNNLSSSEELEVIVNKYSDYVFKILNRISIIISDDTKTKIKNKLSNSHISFVDKINLLYKKINPSLYKRDIKQDKEFLLYYSTIRNSMHNNFFANRDAKFITSLGIFETKKGEQIDNVSVETILTFIDELNDIAEELFSSLEIDFIADVTAIEE